MNRLIIFQRRFSYWMIQIRLKTKRLYIPEKHLNLDGYETIINYSLDLDNYPSRVGKGFDVKDKQVWIKLYLNARVCKRSKSFKTILQNFIVHRDINPTVSIVALNKRDNNLHGAKGFDTIDENCFNKIISGYKSNFLNELINHNETRWIEYEK